MEFGGQISRVLIIKETMGVFTPGDGFHFNARGKKGLENGEKRDGQLQGVGVEGGHEFFGVVEII